MTELEIIELLKGSVGEITTAVGAVAGSLITAIFLRNNTSIKEFEKIKAGRFNEVTEELLSSGKMTYRILCGIIPSCKNLMKPVILQHMDYPEQLYALL